MFKSFVHDKSGANMSIIYWFVKKYMASLMHGMMLQLLIQGCLEWKDVI